jgi:alanine racemase
VTPVPDHAAAILTIDLGAIAANWRLLRTRVAPAACAAVVKADAYGLGADRVIPALRRAGCRDFFVATLDEAIAARRALEDSGPAGGVAIYVLNGLSPGAEEVFAEFALVPVLNSLGEIDAWAAFGARMGAPQPAALHIDTGMSRLGLPQDELERLRAAPERLSGIDCALVMSHLACADEPTHPLNDAQLRAFRAALAMLPPRPASLANSSGIFLESAYHFDLARPGAALYGVAPQPDVANPMRPVVRLEGRVLQVRALGPGASVGYGAAYRVETAVRIATVAVGYADGYFRALSQRARGHLGGVPVPLVGRVSMDLITFDVSHVPEADAHPGQMVELIGPRYTVDQVAADAGTIGYEILTALGRRYRRVYREDMEPAA